MGGTDFLCVASPRVNARSGASGPHKVDSRASTRQSGGFGWGEDEIIVLKWCGDVVPQIAADATCKLEIQITVTEKRFVQTHETSLMVLSYKNCVSSIVAEA